uniref:Uncharacterized protein n=1 Tax=Melopsittacus undulatus TaxID=13146 RepID=A0A8C6JBM9_MELUD
MGRHGGRPGATAPMGSKPPAGVPPSASWCSLSPLTAGPWWKAMFSVPNSTAEVWSSEAAWLELEPSPCMVSIIPIVYYSVLLGLGLPVNILTAVAMFRLATRTKNSLYWYLLALTASDILTQVFIIFMGFILQTAILAWSVPSALIHTINVLEFTANHASTWITVLLSMDRYMALCHPLRYRTISYLQRTHKVIVAVFIVALATAIPFYWWLDMWRDADPPTALDTALKWVHCITVYFVPSGIFLATNPIIICRLRQWRCSGGGRTHLSRTTALLLAETTAVTVLWRDWHVHLALDITNMVAMLNTALNFFLYYCVSQTFPRTVSVVLQAHCRHSHRHGTAASHSQH